MDPQPPWSAPLTVIWLSHHPDDPARTRCPSCQKLLEVHPAEGGQPERLLGTCPACGGRYLLEREPGGERGWSAWNGGSCPDILAN